MTPSVESPFLMSFLPTASEALALIMRTKYINKISQIIEKFITLIHIRVFTFSMNVLFSGGTVILLCKQLRPYLPFFQRYFF